MTRKDHASHAPADQRYAPARGRRQPHARRHDVRDVSRRARARAARPRAGPSTRSLPRATSSRTRAAPVTSASAPRSSRSACRSTRSPAITTIRAHGRDPRERLVPARRRAAARRVVRRAAQHVPRRRGRRRPRPGAAPGLRKRSPRTRASTSSSRCTITRCRWAAPGSTASRCATRSVLEHHRRAPRRPRRRLRPRASSRRDRTRNRVRFLSTPSTCAQFLPGSEFFALDDRPPGMRWIELYDDGRIETEVAWVRGART